MAIETHAATGAVPSLLSNFKITYTGEELLQEDLSVWMSLVNLASQRKWGDALYITGYQLVKDLGWRMHGDSYDTCKESIARLKANSVNIEVKSGDAGYSGSLIREYAWTANSPDGRVMWMVRFEPRIVELFSKDMVTFVEWQMRKQIGPRNKIALWLHAFYMSHTNPFPYTVGKLHELAQSEERNMHNFKARLFKALTLLQEKGFLTSFEIKPSKHVEQSMVHVNKAQGPVKALSRTVTQRIPAA